METLQEKLNNLKKGIAEIELLLETQKFTYPIYCKSKHTGRVVKFTALEEGTVVINRDYEQVGSITNNWVKHTDHYVWQELKVCPITGFFDGQAVWSYNGTTKLHSRTLRFYDAVNKCTFTQHGYRHGASYQCYEAFEGDYPQWMLEAFSELKL